MKKIFFVISLFLVWGVSAAQTIKARRLEILFLGDNGHHKPIERVPTIMAALGDKGINFTYTDKLEDINTKNLSKYDALMIYANWDTITPEAEKALLAYVSSGKGILPIHCASYCFRNSPEYVKMVGGQFWRHKMDSIRTQTVQPTNPIMLGLKPFTAYDETYLHTQLQPDNNVLAVREIKPEQAADKPNEKTEPYTWTRTYGKGRVFYTAYGHDERTWDNPDFQALIERGILWAVDEDAQKAHAALNQQPFSYAEAKLPNYEKRPGVQLRQDPLSYEESVKNIQIPVDFNFSVFAHEPNIMHPIAMDWDERGRLYVLITKDYPNERKQTGGSDYILICEDTDNDGKADKFTHFADSLSIPTGMVFANGGLIVSQAPHMLFLKDTDGDDKADVKKILFTGFGTFDTHAGPSNLHYGFDNWIWGCVGYSGFKGKVGEGDSLKFAQAFFRFKPDGSKLEWMTTTSNNTWGFAFNETGDVFGSTANNSHGWYMAIPHRDFLSPGVDNGSRGIDTHKDMKPITSKIRQVDVFGGFTAASGHNFYTARAFPKKYWNKIAFVCEPTGHIVHQNNIVQQGTDYHDEEAFNLLAGADEWVAPVFAEVGPDGAVWIADWYSFIIQHNPKPKGFEMGTGNAYETNLRDFTHGRIYRVAYNEAPAYKPLSLSKERSQELLVALKNNNLFWRMNAQRLLVERGQKDVVPQLLEMLKDQSLDETGINPTVIHAIRTLEGLGTLSDANVLSAVVACLSHPCPDVRKTAVQVLPKNTASVDILLKNNLLSDKEPLIVLNTILALTEMPLTSASSSAILTKLDQSTDINDRWLPDAFAAALTSHDRKLLKTLLKNLTEKAATQPKASLANEMPMSHDHAAMMEAAKAATVKVSGDKPDLVITKIITEPATPSVRENVAITIEIKNQGGMAIPKGTIIPLSIRIEGTNRKIDYVSQVFDGGLAAGESVNISKVSNGPWTGNLNFYSDNAETFTINITVDRNNEIKESNETNNSFTQKLIFNAPKSMANYALERAVRSYASVAPVDSVISLLRQSQKLDEAGENALIKGLSEGWNNKKKATVTANDKTFLASLNKTVSPVNRERLNRLEQIWEGNTETNKDPNVQVITLKTVREAMQFSKKVFTVTAGKTVEIILENPDAMQHNLVIGKPKTMEVIGKAADKMITAKDGAEKNYVPVIPQIIASTPLVGPNETYRLKFTVPMQVGDYPFVCTFPGHWRIMNGIMKVEAAK